MIYRRLRCPALTANESLKKTALNHQGRYIENAMRRLFYFLLNNVREHLMLYLMLWLLLALLDIAWLYFN